MRRIASLAKIARAKRASTFRRRYRCKSRNNSRSSFRFTFRYRTVVNTNVKSHLRFKAQRKQWLLPRVPAAPFLSAPVYSNCLLLFWKILVLGRGSSRVQQTRRHLSVDGTNMSVCKSAGMGSSVDCRYSSCASYCHFWVFAGCCQS